MLFATPPLSMDAPPARYEVPQAPSRPQSMPAPPRKLSEIPGVTVTYYDVVGTDIPKLHISLEKSGPRDVQTHRVTPATSNWSIGSAIKYTKTGGQCTLTGATLKFTATAVLPRLGGRVKLPATALASWNAYVAVIEDRQAAQLAFVHDRMGEVRGAILHSNCGNWQKAASAAIQRLSDEQAQAFRPDPKTQPKLLEPDKES
jgi:predicted secreted Zn-dependent protease